MQLDRSLKTLLRCSLGISAHFVTSKRSDPKPLLFLVWKCCGVKYSPISGVFRNSFFLELLIGTTTGCYETLIDTGYWNTDIFNNYIRHNFSHNVHSGNPEQRILLLYDGHRSHIFLSLIHWTRENNINLFSIVVGNAITKQDHK